MQGPEVPLEQVALFFDFDGTLVNIAPTPDAVTVMPSLQELLHALSARCNKAIALITGRSLESLDALSREPLIDASGSHGAVNRHQGHVYSLPETFYPSATLIQKGLEFAKKNNLIFENKKYGLSFHFRAQPQKETLIDEWLEQTLEEYPKFVIQRGKCVREIKPESVSKGCAVDFFMRQKTFANRIPWYFGDDVTDEDAFQYVNHAGGVSVKIGSGSTLAKQRLDSPKALHLFLNSWLQQRR